MTKVNHQSHCELVEGKESIQNEGILSHLKRKHVSEIELVLFAFALVLGNRNVTWNQSLVYGFDSYLFNVLFVGSAYVCLALCMGEMSSALPFSGGIFGFVRAAAGPYFGYVTSWFEIAFVSTYVIIKVDQLIKIMVALKVMAKDFTPYAVVVFYTSSFILNVLGGKPLWGLVCIIGFAAFCLYLIYLGGAADASLSDGSLDYQTFCHTGIPLTMGNIMPGRSNINGFYQGLQFVPLLSDTLKNPRDQVPRALMICAVVFVFFSVFLSLSSCSQYPGITKLTKSKYPLVYGFSNVFNVSLQDSIWFNVPGMYGVAFCLFYCGGKQIHAISKSGLLKSALSFTTPVLDTPYMSYLVSTVSGIVLNVYVFYYPEGYDELRNIAVLASHLVFFIAFLTFILFKFNYSSLTRSFTSPLGIWGAIYGMGNYFIGLVSIVFYSGNTYYSVYALICVFAFSSGLFWLIIARNQSFSEEEKKLMFKAYLINANREKRMKILKRNKKGVQSSTNSKGASTSNVNKSNLPGCDASEIIRLPESSSPDQNECCDVEEPSKNLATTRLPANTSFSSQVTPPQTEPLSVRINTLLSGKMHAVFPSDSMKSSSSTKIDRQLLILEAGGLLDRASEKALCAELGLDADFCENIIQETEHQLETHHIHQNI